MQQFQRQCFFVLSLLRDHTLITRLIGMTRDPVTQLVLNLIAYAEEILTQLGWRDVRVVNNVYHYLVDWATEAPRMVVIAANKFCDRFSCLYFCITCRAILCVN